MRKRWNQQPEKGKDALSGAAGPAAHDPAGKDTGSKEQRSFVKMPQGRARSHTTGSGDGQFALRSRAEVLYPEMFDSVNADFWDGLSSEQRDAIVRVQAVAMEKVGYEPGTDKFFIDGGEDETDLRTVAGRKIDRLDDGEGGWGFIVGGLLIGGALAAISLSLSPLLAEEAAARSGPVMLYGGLLAAVLGALLAWLGK